MRHRLALEHEQREVVRQRVGERDRDQGVGELARQLARRVALPHLAHAAHAQPVERGDDPNAHEQPQRAAPLLGHERARAEVLEERDQVRPDRGP